MPSCARKDSHLRERQLWQEPAAGYRHCGKHRKAPEPAAKLCMCGLMEPSRAHLTWACPQTSAYRTAAALDIPADRASERLFAPPLEAYPPAPATCHDEGHWFCACLGTSYGFGWCWFILLSVCGLLCVVRVLFLFLRGLCPLSFGRRGWWRTPP